MKRGREDAAQLAQKKRLRGFVEQVSQQLGGLCVTRPASKRARGGAASGDPVVMHRGAEEFDVNDAPMSSYETFQRAGTKRGRSPPSSPQPELELDISQAEEHAARRRREQRFGPPTPSTPLSSPGPGLELAAVPPQGLVGSRALRPGQAHELVLGCGAEETAGLLKGERRAVLAFLQRLRRFANAANVYVANADGRIWTVNVGGRATGGRNAPTPSLAEATLAPVSTTRVRLPHVWLEPVDLTALREAIRGGRPVVIDVAPMLEDTDVQTFGMGLGCREAAVESGALLIEELSEELSPARSSGNFEGDGDDDLDGMEEDMCEIQAQEAPTAPAMSVAYPWSSPWAYAQAGADAQASSTLVQTPASSPANMGRRGDPYRHQGPGAAIEESGMVEMEFDLEPEAGSRGSGLDYASPDAASFHGFGGAMRGHQTAIV